MKRIMAMILAVLMALTIAAAIREFLATDKIFGAEIIKDFGIAIFAELIQHIALGILVFLTVFIGNLFFHIAATGKKIFQRFRSFFCKLFQSYALSQCKVEFNSSS